MFSQKHLHQSTTTYLSRIKWKKKKKKVGVCNISMSRAFVCLFFVFKWKCLQLHPHSCGDKLSWFCYNVTASWGGMEIRKLCYRKRAESWHLIWAAVGPGWQQVQHWRRCIYSLKPGERRTRLNECRCFAQTCKPVTGEPHLVSQWYVWRL